LAYFPVRTDDDRKKEFRAKENESVSTPFLGEIKMISWNYAPRSWAFCNGQQLPINQNQALFSLLGTMYGGNGQTTFALPDFRGRSPFHVGGGLTQGQAGGQTAHTLTLSELPAHNHFVGCNSQPGDSVPPTGKIWAQTSQNPYGAVNNLAAMDPSTIGNTGGSQPHNNMQPYLVINFIIALTGIFPSQN
jgi:microcystin-dependent protein